MDTPMSDSSMHDAVESFTLQPSLRRRIDSTASSADGTTTFLREQCAQSTSYLAICTGSLDIDAHRPFLNHIANLLDYLERSVAMTPEMRLQSGVDDCMRLLFANENVTIPDVFAKRARDLYLSWVLDDQTTLSSAPGISTAAAADGGWAELTVQASAANISRERAVAGEHGESELADILAGFGVQPEEDELAAAMAAGIQDAFTADENAAKERHLGVFASSSNCQAQGTTLDVAKKFHSDLLAARATCERLLIESSPEEIANLRVKKTNTIARMTNSLAWMSDLLRSADDVMISAWPQEFWIAIKEPFEYVVGGLGRMEEWVGCAWAGEYRSEVEGVRARMMEVKEMVGEEEVEMGRGGV